MDPNGVAHLWKSISQRTDRWNLRWLDACMQESPDACLSPTCGNLLEVFLEVPKNDVTVAVDQRRGGRHRWAKTRFRPILPVDDAQLVGSRTLRTAELNRDF